MVKLVDLQDRNIDSGRTLKPKWRILTTAGEFGCVETSAATRPSSFFLRLVFSA